MNKVKEGAETSVLEILEIDPRDLEKIQVPQYAIDSMADFFLRKMRAVDEKREMGAGQEL